MKKLYFFVISIFLVLSCTDDGSAQLDETELQFENQKWELVRMTGNIDNAARTGDEMEWNEYYVFAPNGTFEKIRERGGIISKAKGIFEVAEYNNDEADYLELTYQTGQELIGACSADQMEVLIYRSSTEISNTWMACDGPGLDYILVKD